MPKVSVIESESESSSSESDKMEKTGLKKYLDEAKIQTFYEACQRLKKFYCQTKSLSLEQNEELFKYLTKFQKPQKQQKNDAAQEQDIVDLAKQRVERMIRSQKPKKNWNLGDRIILDWVVVHYALLKEYKNIEKQFVNNFLKQTKQDWKFVASLIPGGNTNSCMFKWLSLHKTNLNQANWSEEESQLLKLLVSKYVNANKSIRWKDVCKKLYLQNQSSVKNYRTQKQCKEHWICKLNPNIKRQPWTQEEDILLLQTIKKNSGIKKWVEMVKLFKGRTQNAVKNRYNLIIQKEKKFIQKDKDELELIQAYLQRCYVQKFTLIIEPDSQEKENQKEKKRKATKIKNKKDSKSVSQLMMNFQFLMAKGNITEANQSRQFQKEQKSPLVSTSFQQMKENSRSVKEFNEIEDLDDHRNYNHRAYDKEYDLMDLDYSIQ